jgi:pilus assembly protein Flp/PilA
MSGSINMLRHARSTVRRLGRDQRGASLLEYSVLIGIILAVTVGAIITIGGWASNQWSNLKTEVDKAAPATPTP